MAVGQPLQPIVLDVQGVIRFKENAIVSYLLQVAAAHGCSLNELACIEFPADDREQFAQLMGYSVSGFGDLSYANPETVAQADAVASKLQAETKNG